MDRAGTGRTARTCGGCLRLVCLILAGTISAATLGAQPQPGFPDASFGAEGLAIAPDLQPDGRMLVVGSLLDALPDGTLDPTFGSGGIVITRLSGGAWPGAIGLQADGKILVAGLFNSAATGSDVYVMRHHPNGFLDDTFPAPAWTWSEPAVARYRPSGTLDPAFAGTGLTVREGFSGDAPDVVVQTNGKLLVAARTHGYPRLWRLHPNGTRDTEFGPSDMADARLADCEFRALALQADGKVIAAGACVDQSHPPIPRIVVARYHGDRPDGVFADGFDSGDTAAWSASASDGGDVAVVALAAAAGTPYGVLGQVNDTTALYVQDDTPDDEARYRARFWLDPRSFDPGEAQHHRRARTFVAFSENPGRRLAAIVLRRLNGAYSVMGRARLDDNSQADTGWTPIGAGPHRIELDLKRSSGPDANDGWFRLWVDGALVADLGALDNSLSAVDFVRLGALSLKGGAVGTLSWDQFESRRQGAIGP